MSDLSEELRQLAADASQGANPMDIAEVIRRGNRRRTRTIAQRSAGGLSAIVVGAAVLFTGAATHHARHVQADSGSPAVGAHTLSVTTVTHGGNMSMQVKYTDLPAGKMKLVSVSYSGFFKKNLKNPLLAFGLGGPLVGSVSHKPILFTSTEFRLNANQHNFSGSLPTKSLMALAKSSFMGNRSFRMALSSTFSHRSQQVMDATVILTTR